MPSREQKAWKHWDFAHIKEAVDMFHSMTYCSSHRYRIVANSVGRTPAAVRAFFRSNGLENKAIAGALLDCIIHVENEHRITYGAVRDCYIQWREFVRKKCRLGPEKEVDESVLVAATVQILNAGRFQIKEWEIPQECREEVKTLLKKGLLIPLPAHYHR